MLYPPIFFQAGESQETTRAEGEGTVGKPAATGDSCRCERLIVPFFPFKLWSLENCVTYNTGLCILFPVTAPIAAVAAATATSHSALNVAALLACGTQVTPQIAMAAQMAALQARTLAETGIAVPSYYNPSAVNPMKFAEQEKKRKMLWQGKKEGVRLNLALLSDLSSSFMHAQWFLLNLFNRYFYLSIFYYMIPIVSVFKDKSQTAELWEKLNFGNKNQNVKFRKLMGIKASTNVILFNEWVFDTAVKLNLELMECVLYTGRGWNWSFQTT